MTISLSKEPEEIVKELVLLDKIFIQCNLESCDSLTSVKIWIEKGADIYANEGQAIINSIIDGKLDILQYFVSLGYDLSQQANYGLSYAAKNGHLETIQYLIEQGADVSYNHYEAYQYAAFVGHLSCVLFFIEQGCKKEDILLSCNHSIKEHILKMIETEKIADKLNVLLKKRIDIQEIKGKI